MTVPDRGKAPVALGTEAVARRQRPAWAAGSARGTATGSSPQGHQDVNEGRVGSRAGPREGRPAKGGDGRAAGQAAGQRPVGVALALAGGAGGGGQVLVILGRQDVVPGVGRSGSQGVVEHGAREEQYQEVGEASLHSRPRPFAP